MSADMTADDQNQPEILQMRGRRVAHKPERARHARSHCMMLSVGIEMNSASSRMLFVSRKAGRRALF